MKKYRNNRGAALVSIIIAMAVVALLGTVILYVTYTGLSMRTTARNSSKTFYSAESVMDEIVAGLEQDMSDQYVAAYTTVMTNYGSFASVVKMEEKFKSEFILNMVDVLHQTKEVNPDDGSEGNADPSDANYSTAKLRGYVSAATAYGATITVTYDTTRTGANQLQTLEDGLILRNIKVVYQKDGYESTIVTDIKISSPQVEFAMISNMPDISNYTYIADQGINLSNNITLTLHGNAYSGNDGTSDVSMTLNGGSTLNASDSSLLIAKGDVLIKGNSTFTTGATDADSTKTTDLWAENITADRSSTGTLLASNTISLLGNTYVGDDVTLNGQKNTLTLGGQFYGYSSGTAAADVSSSIIVNGANTTLDMSDLNTLVVAGTAFVHTSATTGVNNETNKDVITGDSVALKSNQYAYMVPTECSGITANPMNYTQYNALDKNDLDGNNVSDWIDKALSSNISSLNRSIDSYGDVTIVPVFSNETTAGVVYLYLSFSDVTDAAQYFHDICQSSSSIGKKVTSYMDNYLASVKFNVNADGESQMTRLITNGSYLTNGTYDTAKSKWTAVYSNDSDPSGIIAQELGNYASTYSALCTKLITSSNGITSTEQGRTVFANLIDEDKIDEFLTYSYADGASIGSMTDSQNRTITGAELGNSGVYTYIVDNEGKDAVTISTSGGKGLLIATGDVILNGNWEGLIICKGSLTIGQTATLKSNSTLISSAFRLGCTMQDSSGNNLKDTAGDDITYSVQNFFRGGENYKFSTSGSDDDGDDMTDVRNCIAYENWTSQ